MTIDSRASIERDWPERLSLHGYVVLDRDDLAVERSVNLAQLGKARAIRRFGTTNVPEITVRHDPRDLLP